MTFQALLFCQDEKTTRVTTQLLNELEFSVETSTEPFAAVKKLMAQHFDAVVVDCDNEQNAGLLFKGARNSQLNQSSLAVAVVEGQAGVANAFRLGANLVLTKPINMEQAKGTLRVARGLLKKGGESAKAATPAAPAAPPAPAPAPVKPAIASSAPRPSAPVEAVAKPMPQAPVTKPIVAATEFAKSTTEPANVLDVDGESGHAAEEILLDVLEDHSAPATPVKAEPKPASMVAPSIAPKPAKEVQRPVTVPVLTSGGAASAPAPAKELSNPAFEKFGTPASPKRIESPAPAPASSTVATPEAPGLFSQRQSVPSFAGLDDGETEKSGGAGKFAIIGVAVVTLAVAGYFGYTKFAKPAPAPVPQVQQEPAASTEPPVVPSSAPSPSMTTPAAPQKPTPTVAQHSSASAATSSPHMAETAKVSEPEPEVVVTKIEPEPRVVKANPSKPSAARNKESDAEAPSLVGSAAPGDQTAISNIVSSAPVNVPSAAPPAEMLKVSQGVTQGLLTKRVQPVYPHTAMQMRIAGAVQLQAVINKEGGISSVKVLSGDPILAHAAVDAVKQWKYKPYMLNDEAVEIQTQITVNFKLP
ncbi:MAG TPA: TonB family protein [Terriglobales bacterium]